MMGSSTLLFTVECVVFAALVCSTKYIIFQHCTDKNYRVHGIVDTNSTITQFKSCAIFEAKRKVHVYKYH